MEQSDIEDAAMFLLHLRTQRSQVSGLPGELSPKTLDDAYDIQDATHRFAGWPISMLKVGCTSEIAREVLGIAHPIAGRVPAGGVFESGSAIPVDFFASAPMVECEIAIQVDGTGQPRAIAPAIELINARYSDTGKVPGLSLIADNSAGCGAVLGQASSLVDAGDLDTIEVALIEDGSTIVTGSTQTLLGGTTASLTWMLDHEKARSRPLEDGTWIITGTCTGLTPTNVGSTYTADFGHLGSVSFTLV